MDFLKSLDAKIINICECGHCVQLKPGYVFDRPNYSDKQWLLVSEGLNRVGEIAQKNDMFIAYHYHMGTMIQGSNEIERIMEMTDPDLVHLLVDTGHSFYSGGDPLKLIKKYRDRIKNVHLKDIRKVILDDVVTKKLSFLESVKAGVFTVPGDGYIDFIPIFEALKNIDYKGWFVVEAEQDPDKANPLEYAKKARDYINKYAGI